MDKRSFLKYSLAAVISASTIGYAAPSDQQGQGIGPRGPRERPSQLEGAQQGPGQGRYQGQIPEGMRKMMEERRQKLQELGKELESLKNYKFPDAEKNSEYQRTVEKILNDYKELAKPPVRPEGMGPQGRDGSREGNKGSFQRPERSGKPEGQQGRPSRTGNSETQGKPTRPPLEEKTE